MSFLTDTSLWSLSLYLLQISLSQAGFAFAASVITLIPAVFVFAFGQLFVAVGDRVEEGTVLAQIDLVDLEELISTEQNEIAKLDTQIQTILMNESLAQEKQELALARAREDYELQARIGDTKVGRAQESYVQAEEALTDAQENGGLSEEDEKTCEKRLMQTPCLWFLRPKNSKKVMWCGLEMAHSNSCLQICMVRNHSISCPLSPRYAILLTMHVPIWVCERRQRRESGCKNNG